MLTENVETITKSSDCNANASGYTRISSCTAHAQRRKKGRCFNKSPALLFMIYYTQRMTKNDSSTRIAWYWTSTFTHLVFVQSLLNNLYISSIGRTIELWLVHFHRESARESVFHQWQPAVCWRLWREKCSRSSCLESNQEIEHVTRLSKLFSCDLVVSWFFISIVQSHITNRHGFLIQEKDGGRWVVFYYSHADCFLSPGLRHSVPQFSKLTLTS